MATGWCAATILLAHHAGQRSSLTMSRISEKSPALTLTVRPATTHACISPDLGNDISADPDPRRHRAGTPVRRTVRWTFLVSQPHDLLDRARRYRWLTSATRSDHANPADTLIDKAGAPPPHRVRHRAMRQRRRP